MDKDTRDIIEKVAEEAAHKAVCDTLLLFGMDPKHPIESQKNMAAIGEMRELIEDPEFRASLVWVRDVREAIRISKMKGLKTAVGILVTFAIGLVVLGFKTEIGKWIGG